MALQDPNMHHSDSDDDDPDYVPPAVREESPSSDEDADNRSAKRPRTSSPLANAQEDDLAKKQTREALWANFQTSVNTPPPPKIEVPPRKKVKVEKRYRFAGEEVREIVEVDEDSEDAKKWPLWLPESAQYATTPSLVPTPQLASTANTMPATPNPLDNAAGPSHAASPDVPQAMSAPPLKRPPPRKKSKISLASLPEPPSKGAAKAKKLSTLDKSAMDWQAHLATEGGEMKEALDANRRGGGYLEKVDFLQRVTDRKEEALEANKGSKRRR